METNVKEQERRHSVINALWLRLAADNLSRTTDNYLSTMHDNPDNLFHYSGQIGSLVDMCNDLLANDRSLIPHYLKKAYISNYKELSSWLDYLEKHDIFSEKEVEILYDDYKSLVEETDR